MLKTLRTALFNRLLRQTLAAQKRKRKIHTLKSANTIGILFDATEEKDRRDVLEFAHNLEEGHRKRVKLLGFVDTKKHVVGQTLFPQFTQKDLRWNGKPEGDAVQHFLAEKYDLLLCLNPTEANSVAWVAAAVTAFTKIGMPTATPHDFDIMLEAPREKGIPFFLHQLDLYLDKIVPSSKHEPASTI